MTRTLWQYHPNLQQFLTCHHHHHHDHLYHHSNHPILPSYVNYSSIAATVTRSALKPALKESAAKRAIASVKFQRLASKKPSVLPPSISYFEFWTPLSFSLMLGNSDFLDRFLPFSGLWQFYYKIYPKYIIKGNLQQQQKSFVLEA